MSTAILPAAIAQPSPRQFSLSGSWTARAVGDVDRQLDAQLRGLENPQAGEIVLDGSKLESIDSVGVWLLQRRLKKLQKSGASVRLLDWSPQCQKLMDLIASQEDAPIPSVLPPSLLEQVGIKSVAAWHDGMSLLSFVGESAMALLKIMPTPKRWRWRPMLHNIELAGFNALPIIGLTAFLLGIVVAYQGADQLRHYGANIFVVELVGYSMLREFAPLITAIIIAGRSGSAYAAQIGTMIVTEEIDGLRTIGIEPIELLVLPKILALLVALPLLTVFADVAGVFGGMVMARSQLDVGFHEFYARFESVMHLPSFLIGIGKALVFAVVIAIIGCFQGFQTRGNADSVGRETTRSVVRSIFIVIVLDAVFSVIFSMLDL